MSRSTSRKLVIDTSIIQSAGESNHPTSSACRNTLESIFLICHRAVLTSELNDEWNKHMTNVSRKWKLSMVHHRKLRKIVKTDLVNIDTNRLSDKDFEVVEKDRFLIEAAFAADRIIVTLDDAFRKALAKTPQGPKIIRTIRWINPVTDGCDVLLDI